MERISPQPTVINGGSGQFNVETWSKLGTAKAGLLVYNGQGMITSLIKVKYFWFHSPWNMQNFSSGLWHIKGLLKAMNGTIGVSDPMKRNKVRLLQPNVFRILPCCCCSEGFGLSGKFLVLLLHRGKEGKTHNIHRKKHDSRARSSSSLVFIFLHSYVAVSVSETETKRILGNSNFLLSRWQLADRSRKGNIKFRRDALGNRCLYEATSREIFRILRNNMRRSRSVRDTINSELACHLVFCSSLQQADVPFPVLNDDKEILLLQAASRWHI